MPLLIPSPVMITASWFLDEAHDVSTSVAHGYQR